MRFGLGAGIEPQLHAPFEERFGFPLIELWGMTEMVRVLADSFEPRQVGTRAFGRAVPGVDVRVVDEHDRDVPDGQPGEMLVRHSAATPRRGCFSGYLNDEAATEAAWRGGWFHTGDVVCARARRHAAFRRPQEEHHPPLRREHRRRRDRGGAAHAPRRAAGGRDGGQGRAARGGGAGLRRAEARRCPPSEAAEALFRHCYERLAYYKAPGWIHIVDSLPTTGTQKIQKHTIYPAGTDPRSVAGIIDLRARKKRA